MNPFAFLVIICLLTVLLFLITNILYPFLNKDVEYFWFFKKDWFERNENTTDKEENKSETTENVEEHKS